MRLLIVSDLYFPEVVGGGERVLYETSMGLRRRGHRVGLLARKREGTASEETLEGCRVFRFCEKKSHPLRFVREVSHLFQKAFREVQPEVIVFHQSAIARWVLTQRHGVPSIFYFYSPWHEEYEIRKGIYSGGDVSWGFPFRFLRHKPISLWMRSTDQRVLAQMDRIVVLSEFMRKKALSLCPGASQKVRVIPGGVNTDVFHPTKDRRSIRRQLKLPENRFILLTVRNLVPRMGLDRLLHAGSLLIQDDPDLYFVIGGEGFLRRELERLAKHLGLTDFVSFVGFIDQKKLPLYYQASDLFILPTRFLEGFGLVILEAMACGTPVLGTPVGAIEEILGRFEPRCLFEKNDAFSIARKIREFRKDRDRCEALSEKGRGFVENFFTWDPVVQTLENLCEEVAGR